MCTSRSRFKLTTRQHRGRARKKVKNALILTQRVVFHNVHLCMTAATWHSVGIYARNTGSARIHRAQASLLCYVQRRRVHARKTKTARPMYDTCVKFGETAWWMSKYRFCIFQPDNLSISVSFPRSRREKEGGRWSNSTRFH